MHNRASAILIFGVFGLITAFAVFKFAGSGSLPREASLMIATAGMAAALTAWPLLWHVTQRTSGFAMLTGAVIMLLAQVPFAIITLALFSTQSAPEWSEIPISFAMLLLGGWAIAGPFQAIFGAIAGLIVFSLAPPRPDVEDDEA